MAKRKGGRSGRSPETGKRTEDRDGGTRADNRETGTRAEDRETGKRADSRNAGKSAEDREERTTADYYKLHRQAVDDLVNADESNSPEVSARELAKYRARRWFQPTEWMKALFVKFWFSGSVCFFIFWGLGTYIPDLLDMLVLIGVVQGMVTDLLVNNIFRFYAETPGANDRWMMYSKKGYASFPLNILHACVVLFLVFTAYSMVNAAIVSATGAEGTVPLGVEPIGFGLSYLLFDTLLIEMKRLLSRMAADAGRSRGLRR